MPESELYFVQIGWGGEGPTSHLVRMTKGEATLLERGLKDAKSDKEIEGYTIQRADVATSSFQGLIEWLRETSIDEHFGPREWLPEKEEKPWPFIEISNRTLICSHCPGDERLQFPANKGGAKDLGEALKERKIKKWLYSSSVDFPKEYGAPNIDFRSIIEEAAGMDPSEDRPW